MSMGRLSTLRKNDLNVNNAIKLTDKLSNNNNDDDVIDNNDDYIIDAKATEDGTFQPDWLSILRLKKSQTFSDLFHDSFNTKERIFLTKDEDDKLVLY